MEVTVKGIRLLSFTLWLVGGLWMAFTHASMNVLEGRISMSGSIVDTACAIDTGSYEQTIDMGILPVNSLRQIGQGPVQSFTITLIGCRLIPKDGEDWENFSVTFDGNANGEWFSVSGDARGIALSLQDASGNIVLPGLATPKQAIKPGNYVLKYSLKVVSDKTPLRPGDYQTAIRFKLDYY